jgi:predicted RNA-binding protein with PUA-like domain
MRANRIHAAAADPYYDAKATREAPRWDMVDVRYASELPRFLSLAELKTHAQGALKDMALFARSRLSVQPVTDGMGHGNGAQIANMYSN